MNGITLIRRLSLPVIVVFCMSSVGYAVDIIIASSKHVVGLQNPSSAMVTDFHLVFSVDPDVPLTELRNYPE